MYLEAVSEFFRRPWMMFHCMIVREGWIDKSFHDGDYDLAFRKHLALLLHKKIAFFAKGHPEKRYRIHVDPIKSRYRKADEAARVIAGNCLKQSIGFDCIDSLTTRDSKDALGIQLCDVLLGAVLSPWQRKDVTNDAKVAVRDSVASHLGWSDLKAVTYPEGKAEWKFNIWYLENRRRREAVARPVRLKVPMPKWERRH